MNILLGYEVPTGEAVSIPLAHTVITGMTQLSGKTTTLEALIQRSRLRAIVFKTKRGEKGFEAAGRNLPMFYQEKSDWVYVSSLIEATMHEKVRFERHWVIDACKNTRILREVYNHVKSFLATGVGTTGTKLSGLDRGVFTNLLAYLDIILPKIEKLPITDKLEIKEGVNVMDLEGIDVEVQAMLIRSVMEHILQHENNVIVVVPECWKFLPQDRGTPVKVFFERFIREGAAIGNFLWLDAQDLGAVDKRELRSVNNWILGRQREQNEVERTLDQIPLPKNLKPLALDIMRLKIGHFYAACGDEVKLVYVLPAGVPEEMGIKVAKGQAAVEEVAKLLDGLRSKNYGKEVDDEAMWQKKFEELEAKYRELEKKYQENIAGSEETVKAAVKRNEELHQENTKLSVQLREKSERLERFGALEAALRSLIGSSASTSTIDTVDVPSKISVEVQQPPISFSVRKTPPIELTSMSIEGKLAILYAEGKLPEKSFNLSILNDLFEQQFGDRTSNPNLVLACDKFTAWGYFEKVKAGNRWDYRVKLDPKEAKKKGLLTHIEK